MRQEEISLLASRDKEMYDEVAKQNLHFPRLIAPILQAVVPEYRVCSCEDIVGYILKETICDGPVDDVSVMTEMNTEMSSISEKLIRYDSRFKAINPRLSTEEISIYLHIDLEVQNRYEPNKLKYPIVKRGIYYGAREISSQLGILTNVTNYNNLEKVYSIWICNDVTDESLQNTVTSYTITKTDEIGITDEVDSDYDLMTVIIIRRGKNNSDAEIFDYLTKLFSGDIEGICKYVNIKEDKEIMEGVEKMSGLGQAIYEDGMQAGMQDTLVELVKDGLLKIAEAAARAGITEAEFSKLLEEKKK